LLAKEALMAKKPDNPKATELNVEEAYVKENKLADTPGNVSFQLYQQWKDRIEPLRWGKISIVRTTVTGQCGESEGCSEETSDTGQGDSPQVTFQRTVPVRETVRIDVALKLKDSDAWVSCESAMAYVECGESPVVPVMCREPATAAIRHVETMLIVQGQSCWQEGGRTRTRTVDLESVYAKLVATLDGTHGDMGLTPAKQVQSVHANMQDGAGLLALPTWGLWEIEAHAKDDRLRACLDKPFTYMVNKAGTIPLSLCFELREAPVGILFVGPSGQAANPTVLWENESHKMTPLDIKEGMATFTPEKSGRIRLISQDHELSPHEFHVEEYKAHALVVKAKPKHPSLTDAGNLDRIFLEIAKAEIREGERAFFEILSLEGKLIKRLEAENGKAVFDPSNDEPYLIQAMAGKRVVGKQMHKPVGGTLQTESR
jgi:hypothetical protein